MVTLPLPFVAISYPGYFWNLSDHQLYSLKVGGVLRPLRLQRKNAYHEEDCYYISHEGQKFVINKSTLMVLEEKDSEIPVGERLTSTRQKQAGNLWYKSNGRRNNHVRH